MGLFDLFKRRKAPDRVETPRIDFLLEMLHERLEAPNKAYGGGNFLQLVETQLSEGRLDLAIWNIASQVKDCFELANLYWGQGDVARAEAYLRQTLERDQRLVRACTEFDMPVQSYHEIEYAKCAACLLGHERTALERPGAFDPGYEPAFINMLLDHCIDTRDFDMDAWRACEEAWTKKRHPKYRREEFSVYVKALTGGFGSTDEMLAAHARMFAGRAKRNPDIGLLGGYQDNDLIIDHIFAAILKRIGWEGSYRHSWPNTDVAGAPPRTAKQPDRYLGIVAAPKAGPDSDTGIIEDTQAARHFIDIQLRDQKDFDDDDAPLDPARAGKERGKVSGALTALGWTGDPATLDLMRTYRMDHVLNHSTHISLCDPVNNSSLTLGGWTKLLCNDFGLHPDFIAIAGSEERHDYMDPQGAWYVYWKQDKRIYAVERDEWDRPEVATSAARMGLNLWPSYTSFVAWWVSQHAKRRGRS